MKEEYISSSFRQTKKIGRLFAERILKTDNKEKAFFISLSGNLGSGKTVFVQGLAEGLGIKEKALSPTFIIFRKFRINNPGFNFFYHIDAYRLQKGEDLLVLGFKDILSDPKNIIALEWPENVKEIIPSSVLAIKINLVNEKKRKIEIKEIPNHFNV